MGKQYRKELKYVITNSDFLKIKGMLNAYTQPDENQSNGFYYVRTLYFDTCNDDDLRSSVYGTMDKTKLRLRMYPPKSDEVKLEMKIKSGFDGHKTSVSISKDEAMMMMKSRYAFLLEKADDNSLNIYRHLFRYSYMPRVITEYKRCAFVHPVSNIRITYDYDIRASEAYITFLKNRVPAIPLFKNDQGVLEIKYDNILLSSIKDLMKYIDKSTEANSKYANSRLLF